MASILHYPIVHHLAEAHECPKLKSVSGITVVTSFTERDKSVLVSQLERSSINYVNAADGIDVFVKAFKPSYYASALEKVDTEYSLVVDSYDVIINSFEGIEGVLSSYGKKVIYGAWKIHFPNFIDVDFGSDNDLKYLNSGVVFGRTEDLRNFYSELSRYTEENFSNGNTLVKDFEQYWIYRFLEENSGWLNDVGIDFNEILVTNFSVS